MGYVLTQEKLLS